MVFWHFGVSFKAHLAQTASPVIVTSSAAMATPEMMTPTPNRYSSLRMVVLQDFVPIGPPMKRFPRPARVIEAVRRSPNNSFFPFAKQREGVADAERTVMIRGHAHVCQHVSERPAG